MPVPVAVAVAPVFAPFAAFAVAGADQALHVQLHQPLRHVADHLPQQVVVRSLLKLNVGNAAREKHA